MTESKKDSQDSQSRHEIDQLHAAIAALERGRGALDDAVLDLALAPLLTRLAALQASLTSDARPPCPPRPDVEPQEKPPDRIDPLRARRGQRGDEVDAVVQPVPEHPSTPTLPEEGRRLRQVSVLFLDIVGSTRLSQQLDPEDVQAVVDGALAAFTRLVRQHGGEVLRYAGDNLKAAFGAGGTREDDAERAVACGLALLQEAARRGEAVRAAHGLAGFDARVGIHTGPVVRGGGVEQDNSLSGVAVNIAARMEQAAPPGTLRISIDTWRQVQGRFDVQEQPALPVKGLAEPMRTFLVQGVRERRLHGLRHGADGVTSAMVGRDDELARLQHLAAAVLAAAGPPALRTATVIGEAGLGKSRLLAEFQAGLPASAQAGALWRASSHPQGLYQPYGLIRDLLFWQLGVRDSDTQAQAQQTFAAALQPFFGASADEHTALLGQLIGLDYSASPFIAGILRDGKQLQDRGLNAWVRCLRWQATVQPLVLVLDDLQWADDASLDALDHLVAFAPELPLLLLCAARPELLQRRVQWGGAWPGHELIALAPLGAPGSEALAAALLTRLAAPVPALQTLLAAQSAGNPYYMEALLQMLVDTGVVQAAGTHWEVQEARLQGLKVPPTLVGVLQATLDALDSPARRSLRQASVVGAQFWDEALAAIDPQAPEQLPTLSQRELALPQSQSAFDGAREYGFRHHLLHQVTYGTVLKPDKRDAHGHAARWLQGRSQGRENELASQIAEHFERAGDTREAIGYWLRAAEDASRREANSAALAHADRALALDDGTDLPRQVRLHRVRVDVHMRTGDSAAHERALEALEALADRIGDDVLHLALAGDKGWRLYSEARFDEAIQLIERRLAAAGARAPREAGRARRMAHLCLSQLGRHDDARAHGLKGLEEARASGDFICEAAIHNNMGVYLLQASRVGQALTHYEQALEVYQAAGSRGGVANVRVNLAQVKISLGILHEARDGLLRVVDELREIGSRRLEAMARANLAGVLCELGEAQRGYDTALEGLRLERVSGEGRAEAWAHHGAQTAARLLGRFADALDHNRSASAGFKANNDRNAEWINVGAAALNLHALGRTDEARAAADALLAEVDAHGGWDGSFEPAYYAHRVLASLDDPRAEALLGCAYVALSAEADLLAEHVPRDTFFASTFVSRGIRDGWAAAQAGSDPLAGAAATS